MEKLLLFFCRDIESIKYKNSQQEWNLDNALLLLYRVFPDFTSSICGKTILDFGCGDGYQSLALAKSGAKYVLGIDINQKPLKKAAELAKDLGLEEKVEFNDKLDNCFKEFFDIAISQNSMEHFKEPQEALNLMKWSVNKSGFIFLTFGPPWLAPYGNHMQFFIKIPWVNILFNEETIMNVRKEFRDDGAEKFEEVKGGLNKMTVAKFEKIINESNMKMKYKKYESIKGINFLSKIPFIREVFINHVSCVISKNVNV